MKLFFYDCETTGVKYWKNGIHQISGCIEVDGKIKEHFNWKVQPNKDSVIEDEALEVANVTREQIAAYEPMGDVYRKMTAMLGKYVDKYQKTDKFFMVGYNSASFDDNFLRAWFVQNGDKYFGSWFCFPSLDCAILAANYLKDKRMQMVDFKLKTVAAALGIEVDESRLHDAAYDIELTRGIYLRTQLVATATAAEDLRLTQLKNFG